MFVCPVSATGFVRTSESVDLSLSVFESDSISINDDESEWFSDGSDFVK